MSKLITFSILFLGCCLPTTGFAAAYQADLQSWLTNDLTPYVRSQLVTQPRFRNESVRFVVLADENPQAESNKLALLIRDQLRVAVADEPGVRVIWQRDVTLPSVSTGIDCSKDDAHYYIGVELSEDRNGLLSVDVRALDIEDQNWVAGFSRSWRGYPTNTQKRQLREREADFTFRGKRGAPFDDSQFDLLAAYLAHELGCALLRQTGGEYVVSSLTEAGRDQAEAAMLELVGNNLADFRAIQLSGTANTANAAIDGKAHQIDDDLYQYWLTITPLAGDGELAPISANAYIRIKEKYAAAKLIPAITLPIAKSEHGFLRYLGIVQLRDATSCTDGRGGFRNSRFYNGKYGTSATRCYALEVESQDDAVLFFLNHQLSNGLVRLSGPACRTRAESMIARKDAQVRFPLPVDSLLSDSWHAADGWELNPNRDTYYAVATTDTNAARAIAQHISQLPNRCSSSMRNGLEGKELRQWMDQFAAITAHWNQQIDWQVIRVKNMY